MINFISIILDILDYSLIKRESLFLSFFSVISITYIKQDNNYFYKLFILGFFYDFIFTNYYLVNSIIFVLIGYFIKKCNKKINNDILLGLLVLTLYLLLYSLFQIIFYRINIKETLFIIKHYFIINIIYILFLSFIKNIKHNSKKIS